MGATGLLCLPQKHEIRLIKICVYDNDCMGLSFKLNHVDEKKEDKIVWAINLKTRSFGDQQNKYGIENTVYDFLKGIYDTCEDEDGESKCETLVQPC